LVALFPVEKSSGENLEEMPPGKSGIAVAPCMMVDVSPIAVAPNDEPNEKLVKGACEVSSRSREPTRESCMLAALPAATGGPKNEPVEDNSPIAVAPNDEPNEKLVKGACAVSSRSREPTREPCMLAALPAATGGPKNEPVEDAHASPI
jgi:hypothetical protein